MASPTRKKNIFLFHFQGRKGTFFSFSSKKGLFFSFSQATVFFHATLVFMHETPKIGPVHCRSIVKNISSSTIIAFQEWSKESKIQIMGAWLS